jgi:hypothetical protein
MKSGIVFFDNQHNSRLGTLRSLVTFPIFIVIFLLLFRPANTWEKISGALLISFVLCSAIAVQLPTNYKQAGVYGFLVGFVIGSVISGIALNSSALEPKFLKWSAVILPLITAPLAVLTHTLSSKFDWYK